MHCMLTREKKRQNIDLLCNSLATFARVVVLSVNPVGFRPIGLHGRVSECCSYCTILINSYLIVIPLNRRTSGRQESNI